jgi:hypothetical protein
VLESFKVEIGEWVVEVPIERVVSGVSDNAVGAVKVNNLFGAFKRERYDSLSEEEKAELTPEQRRLWHKWDTLRCEMHKCALGSQHFVGGSAIELTADEKASRAEINPDKAAMVHGKVEHAVQKRLSGLPPLRRFFQLRRAHTPCATRGGLDEHEYHAGVGTSSNSANVSGSHHNMMAWL